MCTSMVMHVVPMVLVDILLCLAGETNLGVVDFGGACMRSVVHSGRFDDGSRVRLFNQGHMAALILRHPGISSAGDSDMRGVDHDTFVYHLVSEHRLAACHLATLHFESQTTVLAALPLRIIPTDRWRLLCSGPSSGV